MSTIKFTRRQVLESAGVLLASGQLAQGAQSPDEAAARVAPADELVSVLEFEEQAGRRLSEDAFATIRGSERESFDDVTLRPRMMVPCVELDLSVDLLGDRLFAPIVVAPVAQQSDFHPDGELATARGASAAKTAMIVSSRSSHPIGSILAESTTPIWYQVNQDEGAEGRTRAQQALAAGCKVLFITAPGGSDTTRPRIDWSGVDRLREGTNVPVLLKGVMSTDDARMALSHGLQGVVVSDYATGPLGRPAPLDVLPAIADAVGGQGVVLVDGGFRRGSDLIKALALGAQAVLVGRPVMWGLAAYGADGVTTVLEMLQTELGRMMGCCGKPNLGTLDRAVVKIHRRAGASA